MINKMMDIGEITWEEEDPGCLLESIRTRGVAIPVQVNVTDEGCVCADGRKRLTACRILTEENEKFRRVPVMILNDYSKAGSSFWGNTQNKH